MKLSRLVETHGRALLGTVMMLALGIAVNSPVVWAAVRPAAVYQPAEGGNYCLYMADTRQRVTLIGTSQLQDGIIGDVDGDSLDNDLVFRDPATGGLWYYDIPPDGAWHAENVHAVPGAHSDAVPLTVLRQGGVSTRGLVVYRSESAGQAYAVRVDTTSLTPLGAMSRAYAVDARLQGFKGDLLWWRQDAGTFWRAGLDGEDLQSPYYDAVPLGGGKTIPNQLAKTMMVYSPSYGAAGVFRAADASWNTTVIDGTNGQWGPDFGYPVQFGDVDSDGLDEIVFVNMADYPLQWYSVPPDGGPWNSNNGYFYDNDTWFGWRLHGVAQLDFPEPYVISVDAISDLRTLPDGQGVRLESKVLTMATTGLDSSQQPVTTGFYIEEPDRTSGIRVTGASSATENTLLNLNGVLATVDGERVVQLAGQPEVLGKQTVRPVGMNITSLHGSGAPTCGLLVRVAGRIIEADPNFAWFRISDGSPLPIKVYCPNFARREGFAVVTGCAGAEMGEAGVVPVIRSSDSDKIDYLPDASDLQGPLGVLADFRGIPFNQNGRAVGMPLGGLGAGSIEVSSQGTLMEFGNVNNWNARIASIPGSGIWLSYKTDGSTQVYSLSSGRVCFEGNFPFARLTFPDLPVDLTLWCWSPLILHDVRRSGYPGAIFDAEIRNRTGEPAEVGLVLSYGTDIASWLSGLSGGVPVEIEGTAASYVAESSSGINFSVTASGTSDIRKTLEDAYLRGYNFTSLDMRQACNRSYLLSPFGTTGGNGPLKFGDLPAGPISIYGIPFQIIDDAANNNKSIVMAGPKTSTTSVTIPVNRQTDCLFIFGNCAGWASSGTAQYVIHYSDGADSTVPLRDGYEIGDWMGGSALYSPTRYTGYDNGVGGTYQVFLYAIPTDGTRTVQSIELRKSGQIAPIVFAVTTGQLSGIPLTPEVLAARQADIDRMLLGSGSGVYKNADAGYTLAARALPGAQVLTYQVASPGALPTAVASSDTTPQPNATVYAVQQRFVLAPGEKTVAGLVCTWYAPNHFDVSGYRFGHAYENWFADSCEVAEEIASDHAVLLQDTKRHYDVINTSTLPRWYREMAQSNFYLMPVGTWNTLDGIQFTYESPTGCAFYGTMDVRYYGSFTQLAGFPEVDATVLRQYCSVQDADGFIIHDLGGSCCTVTLNDNYKFATNLPAVSPNPNTSVYAGYWVNLPIKFCMEVARHYQWTGDSAFLQEMWPHVKRAVAWVDNMDSDRDGLPETSYGYDGWSMIDKCGYDANQWNVMLLAVARLADDLGEPGYAAQLRATQQKARAQIEALIWTGSYYKQSATADGGGLDWVSLLQLAGTWYADILGIDDGLPNDHVCSALQVMDDVLGGNALYGLTDALRPDGTSTGSGIADVEAVGWQYPYASHCMYRDLDDIGLRVTSEVWRGLTVGKGRIPWCQEEWINDPPNCSIPYFLLRDQRMGSTMVMTYAAAGLRMDVPRGTASIKPAEWVWQNGQFVLPIMLPKWLGQVKYHRQGPTEIYEITNLLDPVAINSLRLRTQLTGGVAVTVSGQTRQVQVGTDGTVDVGPVVLGSATFVTLSTQ